MTADELEYLKLLVDKHKEVSSAYYTRMNVFLGILVVLLTSAALLITQASTPHPRLFWSSLGVIGLVGLGLAFIMAKVLKTSAQWIDFWHAKIVYFEARHADDGQTRFFFLDRKLSKPELLDPNQHPGLDRKQIEHTNVTLRRIWERDPAVWSGGISRLFLAFVRSIVALWAAVAVFSVIMALLGIDPAHP